VINKDLLEYIQAQQEAGMSQEDITAILTDQGGWDANDVAEAFRSIEAPQKVPVPQKDPATPTIEKQEHVSEVTAPVEEPEAEKVETKATPKDMMVGDDFFPKEEVVEKKKDEEAVSQKGGDTVNAGSGVHTAAKGHGLRVVLGVFGALLLVGASAYAYFAFLKPLPKPYDVIMGSLTSYANLSSVTINGTSTFSGKTQVAQSVFGESGLYSDTDTSSEPEELSTDMSFVYHVSTTLNDPDRKMDGALEIDLGGSYGVMTINLPIDIEYKQIGNLVYVRLTDIGQLPLPIDLSMFENMWVEFDLGRLVDAVGTVYDEAQVVEEAEIQQIVTDVFTDQNIIDFINSHVVIERGDIPDTYHLTMPLDADVVKELATEVVMALTNSDAFKEMVGVGSDAQANVSMEEMRNEVLAGYDDLYTESEWQAFNEVLQATKIDMWVYKNTFLPYMSRISTSVYDATLDDTYLDLDLRMETVFSQYDEPVNVTAPDTYTTLEDLAREIMGDPSFNVYDPLAGMRVATADATIQAYLNNLRVHAELFYDTNSGNGYSGLCSSDAVKTATASIEELSAGLVFCNADDNSYVIEAPLASGVTYYCVDSTGVSTEKFNISEEGALDCGEDTIEL
jgi:hypothetical protein